MNFKITTGLLKLRIMQNKKTLVLGASETEWRYSHKAIHALLNHQIPVVAVGKRQGKIKSVSIERDFPAFDENIHTVTMYLNVQIKSNIVVISSNSNRNALFLIRAVKMPILREN